MKGSGLLVAVLPLMWLVAASVQSSAQEKTVWERDLVYYTDKENVLRLDIARPASPEGPLPAILFLAIPASNARATYASQLAEAAGRGYIGVTLDYHDIEIEDNGKARYPFPTQLLDVKRAIQWLKENAEKYSIDPEEIGVVGWSYGGYLALMAALTGPSDGFEPTGNGPDTSVQAAVSMAGFIDWMKMDESEASWSLGGSAQDMPDVYTKASPLTYVTKDSPPMLLLYGKQDPIVSAKDAAALDQKLTDAGVQHSLYLVNEADHLAVSGYVDKEIVWRFFDQTLKLKTD
ncbi:MAG TPA: alpha/beta hydrolase [Spirochaetia bacterium]|nr:alpha/beta hydrolase [Spirochaetia bacterium]